MGVAMDIMVIHPTCSKTFKTIFRTQWMKFLIKAYV